MIRVARLLTLFAALALIVGLAGSVTAKGRHSHAKGVALAKEVPPDLTPPASAVLPLRARGAWGPNLHLCGQAG